MTIYGWTTMILSVGGVTLLTTWCFYKTMTVPHEAEKVHGYDISNMPENPKRDQNSPIKP